MTEFIKIYDNVLSSSYCSKLIKFFDKGTPQFRNNNNKPRYYELPLEISNIEKVVKLLSPYVDGYFEELECSNWVPDFYGWEIPRIKKYHMNTEDQFGPHVDVGDRYSSKRYLAFLLYLNDISEGGTTKFLNRGITIIPKKGRMVVFPPNWMFPHKGNPTISSDKYILSTYLTYPE